ncbi:hypothetical protein GCM10027290_52560 [Micromonospora sonneratiae]|uniref:ESAT-6-like protein n=1 Tax=Micromonospora sonneratiae TaxID=1184706 RepID=A0ABW3YBI4_9ACTN
MGQELRYEFATIDACVQAMRLATAEVEVTLDELTGKLGNFMADWQGEGDVSYVQTKEVWDSAEGKMRGIAENIANKVKQINEAMAETDTAVAKGLQNVSISA